MKIAVVGAGFAGISVALYLQQLGKRVTLFDKKGLGAGASGIASGLMHPYPGEAARRTLYFEAAKSTLEELLTFSSRYTEKKIFTPGPLVRYPIHEKQREALLKLSLEYPDIEEKSDHFLIHSGCTVHPKPYLEGLLNGFIQNGGEFHIQEISGCLDEFDVTVFAMGAGSVALKESFPLDYIKGQLLICNNPGFSHSIIAKGYVALGEKDEIICGSTYEHHYADELPEQEKATDIILSQLSRTIPNLPHLTPYEVRSGIRVAVKGSYIPLAQRIGENAYILTGFGSRGIVYHGLFGKKCAELIHNHV